MTSPSLAEVCVTHDVARFPGRTHAPTVVRLLRSLRETNEGCWVRDGSVLNTGYTLIWLSDERRRDLAHRVSYRHFVGPIDDGLQIDHLCRVRNCVNPAHLEVVTPQVNTLRGEAPAARNATKTHCPEGHPYSGENLRIMPGGARACRTCQSGRSSYDPVRYAERMARARSGVVPAALGAPEAAAYLGISRRSLYRILAESGQGSSGIPVTYLRGRRVIQVRELDAFLERQTQRPQRTRRAS